MTVNPAPASGATAQVEAGEPSLDQAGEMRLIRARRGFIGLNFAELWRYRELVGFMIWRDILIRYKQTYLGIAWAVVQPVLFMVVFSCVGRLAKLPTYGAPYPLITLAGLLPWQFFSTALSDGSNSLLVSSNMISKVYFPRLIIPTGAVLSGTLDFLVSMILFLIMELFYGVPFRLELLVVPALFLYTVVAAFGAAVWLSALSVRFRDVKYVVPFLTRIGLYACPVAFVSSMVPGRWRVLYSLNPMVGIIDGFRWCALGPAFAPDAVGLLLSIPITVAIAVSGLLYFRATEQRFADLI